MNKEFGLVWEDRPDDNTLKLQTHSLVLLEDSSKRIYRGSQDSEHMLINSDNIFALKALETSHKEKINMIYIDPPYNTGNKDFIYNDHYLDNNDSYKHSKWLTFMNNRLVLAKELLADDGVIFVSIDDNEQSNLRLLLDKIFKPQNFIAQMVWKSGGGVGQDSKFLSNPLEYILVYAKNKVKASFGKKPININDYKLKDEHFNQRGGFKTNGLDRGSLNYSASLDYVIVDPSTNIHYIAGKATEEERLERINNKTKRKDWCWRWSKDKIKWGIENDFIIFKNGKVYFKQYALVNNKNEKVVKGNPYSNFIENISTTRGTKLVKDIIGSGFSYPKPIELINHLLVIANLPDNAIILDFFAGSGTTGHAIIDYNMKNNKNLSSILVTDNGKTDENSTNIAEEITYQRMKRVLTGENWANNKINPSLRGNLSYYKIELKENNTNGQKEDKQ